MGPFPLMTDGWGLNGVPKVLEGGESSHKNEEKEEDTGKEDLPTDPVQLETKINPSRSQPPLIPTEYAKTAVGGIQRGKAGEAFSLLFPAEESLQSRHHSFESTTLPL